jgi:hypothetical protein
MSDAIERDAEEFGKHIRQGGWRLGLLVARNVERRTGQGARRDLRPPTNYSEVSKVSASEFARMAGLSGHDIVTRYLDAWDRQAPAMKLPKSGDLGPGDEIKLPDANLHPFRATEPDTSGYTVHTNTGYEPIGGSTRADEEQPQQRVTAHSLITAADEALSDLARHRSMWDFMSAEDYQVLRAIPAKVRNILADVDARNSSVKAS